MCRRNINIFLDNLEMCELIGGRLSGIPDDIPRSNSWVDSFAGVLSPVVKEDKDCLALVMELGTFYYDILLLDVIDVFSVLKKRNELVFPEKDSVKEARHRTKEFVMELSKPGRIPQVDFQRYVEDSIYYLKGDEGKLDALLDHLKSYQLT